jgi:hypothetical protein
MTTDDEILKVFAQAKPAPATTEYAREQLALYTNRDRLRAEQLAREANAR